jgi:Tol biopolymer transport system component
MPQPNPQSGLPPAASSRAVWRSLGVWGCAAWLGLAGLILLALLVGRAGAAPVLAFQLAHRPQNADIYLLDTRRQTALNLTRDTAADTAPIWLGADRLLFSSNRISPGDLYLADLTAGTLDAAPQTRLFDGAADARRFRPAPNHRWIAYTDAAGRGKIQVLDVQTGRSRDPAPDLQHTWHPAWDSQGARLAFLGSGGPSSGPAALFVVDVTTSALTLLAQTASPGEQPAWSPTDGQIAFVGEATGSPDIYVIDLTTGTVRNLSQQPQRDAGPVWSPDGRHLAYTASLDGSLDIMIADVAAGVIHNATDHPAADGQPAWSPDSTQIAFVSDRRGDLDIFVLDVASGTTRLLHGDAGIDTLPTWSPDGAWIAFLSGTARDQHLIVADQATGRPLYSSRIGIGTTFAWWP